MSLFETTLSIKVRGSSKKLQHTLEYHPSIKCHAEHQVQSLVWNFTPSSRSVLTREPFEASPDVRLRMEAWFQVEIAQLQVNIRLVRWDLLGYESLHVQEAVMLH